MDRLAHNLSLIAVAALPLIAACTGGESGGGGTPSPTPTAPPAIIERSLVWTRADLLDDAAAVGLGRVMAAFATDAHGGALLAEWFDTFGTTAHSQRYGPGLLSSSWHTQFGADPSQWDLDALPMKVTGVHNRVDLLSRDAGDGHCGEFRVSMASVDPVQQPLHVIFLFRQPLAEGDVDGDGNVTCVATAHRWASLSGLDETAFLDAARALLDESLVADRVLLAESVEQTVSPWEWRQWNLGADPPSNPPLFQTVDVTRVNTPGATRDAFLDFVEANAAGLDARTVAIPDAYRSPSARVAAGVPRTPLDLMGVDPSVLAQLPSLHKNIEIVGCPACHTADAEFVQTNANRELSPFYEKELDARKVFLDALASGGDPVAGFAPLQPDPVLPD